MEHPGPAALPASFRVAEWVVDPSACRLADGETAVHLRPLLVDLLVFLARRAGEVVGKDEIIERVWQGRFLSDSVLTRTMTELRHALRDDFVRPRIIETIRKRGYRLIAPVQGLARTPEPRLAVLPFENLNGNSDYDYFAAGISDALTTELGNITSLQVVSRQSVLAVTRTGPTIAEAARRLRVDAVVEGSALHAGDRVRVTAQLIQVEPERHIWAHSYVSDMTDILELQGQVAHAVAEAVEARLTPKEVARLGRPRPANPDAHLAYLKGRYHALRWDHEGLEKGFRFLHESLTIDPGYAPTHAILALAFTVLGYWGHLPVEVAYPKAKEEAARATALDESLGEAHAILGFMKWLMDWDPDGCEAEMRTALELNPSNELVHALLALFLAVGRGDRAGALVHTGTVVDLDPLSMSSGFFAAWLHFFCSDIAGAIAQARTTLEMYPDCLHAHYVLGWSAIEELRLGDAVTAFEEAASLSRDTVSTAYLARAYASTGAVEKSRALLHELETRREREHVPEFLFALVNIGLGEFDAAMASLERCYAAHDARLFWFNVPAIGGTIRRDPRFAELMQRVDAALRSPQPAGPPAATDRDEPRTTPER